MSCNIFSAVIGFFSGAIVGAIAAFVAHLFATNREAKNREHAHKTAKEARKRNFLGFLDGFRAEAERSFPRDFSNVFPQRVYRFREEAAKIRGDIDLGNQETFAELVTALCRLTDSQVEEVADGGNYLGRKRVTEAIDAVKRFIEGN